MGRKLYTIGYEGVDIKHFVGTLVASEIEQVIDIRDVPVSRKRGFSKSALQAELAASSIGYLHLKALGDPKTGRDAMRRGDYPAFLEIYSDHIATVCAQKALEQAVDVALARSSVLLCFERNPKECHRTIVAARMALDGQFEILNIGVNHVPTTKSPSRTAPKTLAESALRS